MSKPNPAVQRAYYLKNKDKIIKRQKAYQLKNKEHKKEYNKLYYKRNKDKILKRQHKYYEDNKDAIREQHLKYAIIRKESLNFIFRQSKEYYHWKQLVYKRDNYTCQQCKVSGCIVHAHHIKPLKDYWELREDVDNGITLCSQCHREVHSGLLQLNNNI